MKPIAKTTSLKNYTAPSVESITTLKCVYVIIVFLIGSFFSTNTMAQFSNVPVIGFNADIVADGTGNPDASTSTNAGVDGAGWVFVSSTFYPSATGSACNIANAYPAPAITSTNTTNNTGITYTLQPETGNNSLRLVGGASADLTLVTPVSGTSSLYLVCLGGDGAAAFTAQVNFSDGSSETITSSAPDWCGGAATYKITPTQYYRILRTATSCTGALCPYIYEIPVGISASNYLKTINSLTLTNTSTGVILHVLAAGRDASPLPQYVTNGNATQDDCHNFTLTPDQSGQRGSVWNNSKIDLSQSFDYTFDIFLGSDPAGADGMAFVLQPAQGIGIGGNGLGCGGITPSIEITFDTYSNVLPNSDPSYDHIAMQRNGDPDHATANNLAGPVTILNGINNAKDGQWHKFRIVWNAGSGNMDAYVDGSLRINHTEDIVATTFLNNPLVHWGFTGATGGLFNSHRFRTILTPHWYYLPNQTFCVNQPVSFLDSTISTFNSIIKIYWDFGDASGIDSVNTNPIHTYTTAGIYTVTQTVHSADGCVDINTQTVTIGGNLAISSTSTDATCTNQGTATLQLPATPGPFAVSWNSNPVQNGITASNLTPGSYIATVTDGNGCTSTHTAIVGVINNINFVTHADTTICSGSSFNANTQSNASVFAWTPTSGVSDASIANPVLSPTTTTTTTYNVHATLQFCDSIRSFTVTVPVVLVNAGNDQTITAGTSIQLQTSASAGTYMWIPATGLSSTTSLSPLANPGETTTYTLTVTSTDGCTNTDIITIYVKPNTDLNCSGPMIAFTPNGDGINDRWIVGLEGCYFKAAVHVYNRYGTVVYENSNYKNDWYGKYKNKELPDGTYYFIIEYTSNNGRKRQAVGNVTILR